VLLVLAVVVAVVALLEEREVLVAAERVRIPEMEQQGLQIQVVEAVAVAVAHQMVGQEGLG
jgi:hypothetical protein